MTYREWSKRWDGVRPGWRALSRFGERAEAKMRFRGVQPFALGGYAFDHATAGEVADPHGGGRPVEVLLWQLTHKGRGADAGGRVRSSGVALTFPYPLPALAVHPPNPLWPPRAGDFAAPSPGQSLFEGDAGAVAGPRFAGTTVVATDPLTVAALVTPRILGLPQLLGRHWRLDGRTAVAWSQGHQSPEALAEVVPDLCTVVAGLPPEI
ncbi:hypothetical protein ABT168_15070 [Streptomyces sp. NPDC001793]|uniref:hypothetical protein n=1 Tax=Streptomyces sp. NPDC001793 TaxID=3154657 RepID=UPI00331EF1A3